MITIGAGYTGGEMLRLLEHHPFTEILFVQSSSNAGKALHHVHKDLSPENDLYFSEKMGEGADVLFLCNGHGEGKKFMEQNLIHHFPDLYLHPYLPGNQFLPGGKVSYHGWV